MVRERAEDPTMGTPSHLSRSQQRMSKKQLLEVRKRNKPKWFPRSQGVVSQKRGVNGVKQFKGSKEKKACGFSG